MLFSDDFVLRSAHFEGNKLATTSQGGSIALCHFGPSQNQSLVCVSQTLDSLLVYELALFESQILSANKQEFRPLDDDELRRQSEEVEHQCIAIKDQVISALEVVPPSQPSSSSQDLLLIGCSSSIMIYATRDQAHLSSVSTSARLTSISALPSLNQLVVCAGVQKLYAYHLSYPRTNGDVASSSQVELPSLDLASERTTSETISCLTQGTRNQFTCLVTGSREHLIKVHPVDGSDQNIQACRLSLAEGAPVTCLCAIETLQQEEMEAEPPGERNQVAPPGSLQMNYLAYGLENGSVGVYHLLVAPEREENTREQSTLFGERLWRHKSKQVPMSLVMFDINGDGLDELIVGYRNGRMEVRSPFTGQLLASTRLFVGGAPSSQQLVGLIKWPLDLRQGPRSASDASAMGQEKGRASECVLLACSSLSSLVAFKPNQKRAHESLRDYLASSARDFRGLPDAEELSMVDASLPSQQENAKQAVGGEKQAEQKGVTDELKPDIETRGDDTRPVASDSRQDPELVRKVGALIGEQNQLELQIRKLYHELVQRRAENQRRALEKENRGLEILLLSHHWDFDSEHNRLRLAVRVNIQAQHTLMVTQNYHQSLLAHQQANPPPNVLIDMVELIDDSHQFLERGHHLQVMKQQEASARKEHMANSQVILMWFNNTRRRKTNKTGASGPSNDWIDLKLRVYCKPIEQIGLGEFVPRRRPVHEQLICLPPFAMFVPVVLMKSCPRLSQDERKRQHSEMVMLTFRLPESVHRLQALDWIQDSFLCFQYGQQRADTLDHHMLEVPTRNDLLLRRYSIESSSSSLSPTGGGASVESDGLEFRFIDLRRLAGTENQPEYHLRVSLSVAGATTSGGDELTLETDDSELLVELCRALVLERLQLSMHEHLLVSSSGSEGVSPLIKKLNSLSESSRQLEESENRIQTEIYESAELIKSLMQQFGIANELNEFSTSRELLAEISMMLDRTHNSAQAYYLNNRSRQDLTREANLLRERVLFLTGGGGDGAGPSWSGDAQKACTGLGLVRGSLMGAVSS